jgi:hypothetical protein
MAEFEFEDTAVSDALTYADQTVEPHGKRMKVEDRTAVRSKGTDRARRTRRHASTANRTCWRSPTGSNADWGR